jgi:hypothetical protein
MPAAASVSECHECGREIKHRLRTLAEEDDDDEDDDEDDDDEDDEDDELYSPHLTTSFPTE